MTFVMSLLFWSVMFTFTFVNYLLALAMLTYVSHANKSPGIELRERHRQADRQTDRTRNKKQERKEALSVLTQTPPWSTPFRFTASLLWYYPIIPAL